MIYIECNQGEPAWYEARCGVVTASCFADAISTMTRKSGNRSAGDPTAASDKYAYELAIERISKKPYGAPVKAWTLERGHTLEPYARMEYETETGNLASEAGVILTDDRKFGYSSDGLVGKDGLIEIKCPVDGLKIAELIATRDVSEYMHQIQGGLWISGRKWCDLVQYVPDLENAGTDKTIIRVERDEAFIDQMVEALIDFEARVVKFEQMLRRAA